jgi:hypothetical protein
MCNSKFGFLIFKKTLSIYYIYIYISVRINYLHFGGFALDLWCTYTNLNWSCDLNPSFDWKYSCISKWNYTAVQICIKPWVMPLWLLLGIKGKRMYNSHFSHRNHWTDNLIGQSAEWLDNVTDIFSYSTIGFKISSKWDSFMNWFHLTMRASLGGKQDFKGLIWSKL